MVELAPVPAEVTVPAVVPAGGGAVVVDAVAGARKAQVARSGGGRSLGWRKRPVSAPPVSTCTMSSNNSQPWLASRQVVILAQIACLVHSLEDQQPRGLPGDQSLGPALVHRQLNHLHYGRAHVGSRAGSGLLER